MAGDVLYLHANVQHGVYFALTVATRLCPVPDSADGSIAQPQTLLIGLERSGLEVLKEVNIDADGNGRISFGPRTDYGPVHARGQTHPFHFHKFGYVRQAIWDSFSSSVILAAETSLLLLAPDNTLHLLAGEEGDSAIRDGDGNIARFKDVADITTDGAGCLYVAEDEHIRRVHLPPSLAGRWHSAATAGDIAAAIPDITVTTLPFQAASLIQGVVYQPGPDGPSSSSSGGALVFATGTALYRVALPSNPTTDGDGGALATQPELLAGAEGARGEQDGPGPSARFLDIMGLVADSRGNIYVASSRGEGMTVHKVEQQTGAPVQVSTLINKTSIGNSMLVPAILPCGYLALTGVTLDLIDLKLQPVPLTASVSTASTAAPAPAPPPRTLTDDLGALLDRQPDDTADVTLLVGDRSFAAHRAILAARSDYFRQRLTGGAFADSREQQLSLPEADPEAFTHVLRFIYTGRVGGPLPGPLARPVAELADRLLLPELCREAQARVLADVTAESVVDGLLWAGARGDGGTFSQLLADLKAWYLAHADEIMVQAKPSLKRLSAENPDLMVKLMELVTADRSSKRARKD